MIFDISRKQIFQEGRIAWVDIYKAVAIILMVLGHATGRFNLWVYQFHMAAFFFVSGYVVNYSRRSLSRTIWDRFFTLLLPYFSVFTLFLSLEFVLQHLGLRHFILGDFNYVGIKKSLLDLFVYGNSHACFLGAGWFVIALFGIEVLGKVLYDLLCKNRLAYFVSAAAIFIFGRWMVDQGYRFHIGIFYVNSIFIGHFYFALGHLARSSELLEIMRTKLPLWGKVACFVVVVCLLQVFRHFGFLVDFASNVFNHNLWCEALAAINGCIFLFLCSVFLESIYALRNPLFLLGSNTLGVLFFHFMFFKPVQLLLIFVKRKDISLLNEFVPKSFGRYSWPLFVVVSIVLSVGLWLLLLKIPLFKFLFGKSSAIYDKWRCFAKRSFELIFGVETKTLSILNYACKTKSCLLESKTWILPFAFSILVAIPMLTQGVMLNDELQINSWVEGGFATCFSHWFSLAKMQGRHISAFSYAFFMTLVELFGGQRSPLNRLLPVFLHFFSVFLYFRFIKRITANGNFAKFCSVVLLAFTPLLFEHTIPNAFNYFLPDFIILLLSFILFYDYQISHKKQKIIWAMILFFAACCSYELFVTYVFVYLVIILETQKTRLFSKKTILLFAPAVITAFIYVAFYCVFRIMFPSGYSGNTIGFSARGAAKVLLGMFRSSVPGIFSLNGKYKYFSALYSNNLNPIDYFRIIGVVLLFCAISYVLIKRLLESSEKKNIKTFVLPLFCGCVYMVLPAFPNSLGQMYQNDFNRGHWLLALPVSYFLLYAAVFAVCWCLLHFARFVTRKKCSDIVPSLISIALALYLIPVQYLNSIVANQQYKDWERICDIHDLLDTDFVNGLGGATAYAPDFFETRNLLAIDAGHYALWQNLKRHRLQIVNRTSFADLKDDECFIAMPFDKYFVVQDNGSVFVVSKNPLFGRALVPVSSGNWKEAVLQRQWKDKSFTIYETNLVVGDSIAAIGKTLNRAFVQKGFYSDGWLQKESLFKIRTDTSGRVDFSFYYPFDDCDDKKRIVISVNGEEHGFVVRENLSNFSVSAPAKQVVDVKIVCSWELSAERKNGDSRELCIVLSKMNGM
ncbi:MAG: acyltransferase [Clostridiales bacterium]|nr:acyltransferase [Clostridiales bacterium]